MILERALPPHLDDRRVTFAALMELHENNYLRLRLLCPDLALPGSEAVSSVQGAADLHLVILERAPYTTRLRLSYRFGSGDRQRLQPNLVLRMFHDARQVEVEERFCRGAQHPVGQGSGGLSASEGLAGSELLRAGMRLNALTPLHCRWRHARFLYRWLGFCLRQGHRFDPQSTDISTVSAS
jgi:uncharacterized protein YqiB (DUF1249 family)